MTFAEWLETKANANRLASCELVLARFRATADVDVEFTSGVGAAVWGLLSTNPGDDAQTLLADMRTRAGALGRERLDNLSSRLLHATANKNEVGSDAGKLVSSWFRVIGLCSGRVPINSRALHVAKAYETTFASLGRLTNQETGPQHSNDQRVAA